MALVHVSIIIKVQVPGLKEFHIFRLVSLIYSTYNTNLLYSTYKTHLMVTAWVHRENPHFLLNQGLEKILNNKEFFMGTYFVIFN